MPLDNEEQLTEETEVDSLNPTPFQSDPLESTPPEQEPTPSPPEPEPAIAPPQETPRAEPTPEETMSGLVAQESGGNPNAVSKAGAWGKTQVMPKTWAAYSKVPFGKADETEQDRVGLAVLTDEYTRYSSNISLALAAYNAGSPRVTAALKAAGYSIKQAGNVKFDEIKKFLPPETQDYVPKVLSKIQNKPSSRGTAGRRNTEPTAGTEEEADTALTSTMTDPVFGTLSAPDRVKKIKEIHDSKEFWTDDANSMFKRVSTVLWKGAYSNEQNDFWNIVGSAPKFKADDTPEEQKQIIEDWKNDTTQKLKEIGRDPILFGDEYDKHFENAAAAEKSASEYRNRSKLGHVYSEATGLVKSTVGGVISNFSGPLAFGPRALGFEETAKTIESAQGMFGTPNRDFFYQVKPDGTVDLDEYGMPKTKMQATISSAVGQGLGLLAGGAALKVAGAGAKTMWATMGGMNVLSTANEAYKNTIENGGSRNQALLSSVFSLPSAAVDTAGDMLVVGKGAKAWVKGLSKFKKGVVLAKESAEGFIKEGTTEALQQQMQDMGTSQAIGKDITSAKKNVEAFIAGGIAGAVVSPILTGVESNRATAFEDRIEREANERSNRTTAAKEVYGNPDPNEHIRLSQELTAFTESPEMETTLKIRSIADVSEEMLEAHGVTGTILPGNKLKVTKKTSYAAPEMDITDVASVNGQMNATSENLADKPPATIEHAQVIVTRQQELNEKWKGINERDKKDIPIVRDIRRSIVKLQQEIVSIEESNSKLEPGTFTLSELQARQKDLTTLQIYLDKLQPVVDAADTIDELKSNANKLQDMARPEYAHEITEQENRMRMLIDANVKLAEEAAAEVQSPNQEKAREETDVLKEEFLALQKELGTAERPFSDKDTQNRADHIQASIDYYKRTKNFDVMRMKEKELTDFKAQQQYYKDYPEEATKVATKFRRLESIRDKALGLNLEAGIRLMPSQAQSFDVYGRPLPQEQPQARPKAATKAATPLKGFPIKTSLGTRVITNLQNSWYVTDETGNVIGNKHSSYYDAIKSIQSENVMAKPAKPVWSSFNENAAQRGVSPEFTPKEEIPHTSETVVNPRDIVKLGRKVLALIHKLAKTPIGYNLREGGREEAGFINKVLGYVNHRKRYIYLKFANDPNSLIHEVAHAVSNDLIDLTGLPHEVQQGLINQAATFYGDPELLNYPLDRILSEGFSNFLEHYASGQPVDTRVLNFYNNTFKATLPEMHEALENLRTMIKTAHGMSNTAYFKAFAGAPKDRDKQGMSFAEKWIDAERFFHNVDALAGSNLEDLNDYTKGQGREMVSQAMTTGFVDSEGTPVAGAISFKEAIAPARKRLNELGAYMVAKYTVFRANLGQATGFPVDRAKEIIYEAEVTNRAEYEGIVKAANQVWHWQEDMLDLAASRSPLFAQIVEKIREHNIKNTKSTENPDGVAHGFYVPFEREFTVIEDVPQGRAKTSVGGSPFMRFTGSTKRIVNPFLIWEERAVKLMNAANKDFLRNQTLALGDNNVSPVSMYIRAIPKQSIPAYKASVGTILEMMGSEVDPQFKELRQAFDEDTQAALLTFFAPEKMPPAAADGYVTIAKMMPGGKVQFYEVAPAFTRAFDSTMPDFTKNPFFQWMVQKPNILFKMGATTFRMAYQIRNFVFRDSATAFFRSKSLNPFSFAADMVSCLVQEFATSTGIANALRYTSPWVGLSKRMGAQSATLYHVSRELQQEIFKASGSKVITGLATSFNYLENVLSSGERATRLASMKRRAKELGITDPTKPLSPEQAMELTLAYKRSTTNFQKQGRYARVANLWIPFFTANIAEKAQLGRDFKERRGRFIAFALGYLALGLYQAIGNKDDKWWQNLQPKDRAANFFTTWGDKIVAIPTSTLGGIFNGLGNMIGDAIVRQDLLKPDISEHVVGLAKNFLPITSLIDVLPIALKEAYQQKTNEDTFTGRSIVPRALEESDPMSQYTASTTELSKELGRIIGYSPAKIDHAFRAMFPAGLDILKQFENLAGVKPITDESKSLAGVFASSVTRPGFVESSQERSTTMFYDLEKKYQVNKSIETPEEGKVRLALSKIKEDISDLNVILSAEPDKESRKELYAKKGELLERGIAIERGESPPVVGHIAEEGRAKLIRKERAAERAARQRAEAEGASSE
jgi:hypothetical protein